MNRLLAAIFLVTCAAGAQAEWEFEVTPYIWAAEISADVRTADFVGGGSLDFQEVIDKLDTGFMGRFEAHNGRWSVLTDVVYLALEDSLALPTGGRVESDMTQGFGLVLLGYKPTSFDVLDVYVGVRYDSVDVTLDLTGPIASAGRQQDVDWTDFVVGVRARYPFNDQWSVETSLFGGTGGSEYTVMGEIGVRWQFAQRWNTSLSYRYSDINYEGDIGFHEEARGALLALGFRF